VTEDGQREAVADELQLARDELLAAEQLLAASLPRIALSPAYFAVFHAVRARLYAAGLEPRTHTGVQTLWNSEFVKSGQYEPATALTLARLQTFRHQADYSRSFVVDHASAAAELAAAADLVSRIAGELA
jgi:uncharacterized protein (UPF0332 family)